MTTTHLPTSLPAAPASHRLKRPGPPPSPAHPPALPPATVPAAGRHARPPLTVLYHNVNGFKGGMRDALHSHIAATDPALPDTPLLYALVETGERGPRNAPAGWVRHHLPGTEKKGQPSGGISLISHNTCPIGQWYTPPIRGTKAELRSTAVALATVAPHGLACFLLAIVYVHPEAACHDTHMRAVCDVIDKARSDHQGLPLLVVGDFNARHPDWHDDRENGGNVNSGDTELANRIDSGGLHIHNQPGMWTRITARRQPNTNTYTHTSTVIDLVLSSPPELVADISQRHHYKYQANDHIPFTLELQLSSRRPPPAPPASRPRRGWRTDRQPLRWQRALAVAMKRCLEPLRTQLDRLDTAGPDINTAEAQRLLEEVYEQLEAAMVLAFVHAVGVKHTQPNGHTPTAWWTPPVAEAYQERNEAYEQLRHSRGDDIAEAGKTAAEKRLHFEEAVQSAKQHAGEQLANLVMDNDSKARYAALRRHVLSNCSSLTGIKDRHGNMPAGHIESLNNLNAAFLDSSVPPPLDPSSPRCGPAPGPTSDPLVDPLWAHFDPPGSDEQQAEAARVADTANSDAWTFTAAQVAVQTRSRTKKTAAGPDTILPLFLAYSGEALYSALATVFNFSWRHSVTPQAWREANVAALYKGKGGRSEPMSYRPISVTSGIVRTFEHLIHDRLAVSIGGQLAPSQFGFRARHSTSDAILQLTTSLQHLCNKTGSYPNESKSNDSSEPPSDSEEGGQQQRRKQARSNRKLRCAALFLDIQKAFDRVDHRILLARLHNIGVRGASWRWIRCFLTDRRTRCVDNQYESEWQPVEYGVPQGCVLSPLLFLVFINGLVKSIEASPNCSLISTLLYADDGALGPKLRACREALRDEYRGRIDEFEAAYGRQLKEAARLLDLWCAASRMRFGQEKTQIVVFNRGLKHLNTHYADVQLCGYTVAVADEYEYLGLTLSNDLRWKKHITRMRAKARTASARITTVAVNARPPLPAVIRELVRSCVIPAFDYCIDYWGVGLTKAGRNSLQAAIAQPLRAALGLPQTTHQQSVLWGYGIPGLRTHVQHKQLQHLRRLARLQASNPDHPTVALYRLLNEELVEEHHNMLKVKAQGSIPTAVYLLTAFLPHTLGETNNGHPLGLDPPPRHPSPASYKARIETAWQWSAPDRARRGGVSEHHRQQQELFEDGLAAMRDPAIHERLRSIRRAAARLEWEGTHMPPTQAEQNRLSGAERASRTTAPITTCTPADDDEPHPSQPPLHFLRQRYAAGNRHDDLVSRARLLYGRSYTAATRLRFPSQADDPITSARCTNATCTEDETVEHLLLHCPRYELDRHHLQQAVEARGLEFALRAVLNPPVHKGTATFLAAYTASNTFLRSIAATRERLGLHALDTRPAASVPPPLPLAAAARLPGPRWVRRRALRRRDALAARHASAPLDTG